MNQKDCAYILDSITGVGHKKVVEFTNIKSRGNVTKSVSYSYAQEDEISYNELLLSVEKVDDNVLKPLKQAAEELSDSDVITGHRELYKGRYQY